MIAVNKKVLTEKLKEIQGGIGSVDFLQNCLIEVDKNLMSIATTNLELYMKVIVPLENDNGNSMKIAINAKRIFEIIKELPDETLMIENKENCLFIKTNNSKFKILTSDPTTFPNFEVKNNNSDIFSFNLPASVLLDGINKTMFAISEQEGITYTLTNLLLQVDHSNVKFIGTDGCRLAIYTVETENDNKFETRCLIPRKSVSELRKFLATKEYVNVKIIKNVLQLDCNDKFYTLLADGSFPDLNNFVPKIIANSNKTVVIEKEKFLKAIKRVSAILDATQNYLVFTFTQNQVEITAESTVGNAYEKLDDIQYDDEDIKIGFNVKFLMEGISKCENEKITIRMSSPENAMYLEEETEKGKYQYILMPVRL